MKPLTIRKRNAKTFWQWCKDRGIKPSELTGKDYKHVCERYQSFSEEVRSQQSINRWLKHGSISNRLLGSMLNADGCAV